MSGDFKQIFTNPQSLLFSPNPQTDLKQHYRLVDPPLTRYTIGAALAIAGLTPLSVDWDWSLSWQDNLDRGAFPDELLLIISRLAVTSLFLVALVLIYQTGKSIHTQLTGLLAVLLLGSNALILIHTRRAMEEGLLLPLICLCIYCFASINKRPWLAALAVLVAVNIKYSAVPLVIIGVLAIFIMDKYQSVSITKRLINLLIFTAIILLGTFILNPIIWGAPLKIIPIAFHERANLLNAQVTSIQQIDPALALTSPDKRAAGLITNLFFSWPAALDIGNYLDALKPSIDYYLALPGTTLFRGVIGGVIFFFLAVFGLILMLFRVVKKKNHESGLRIVLILGFIIYLAALVATVSLPFQRYVIPLLPYTSLLSAYGIGQVLQPNKKAPA